MATLAGLTTRVQTALMDTGAQVWDAGTITEGIRLAVGEYSLAGEAAVTVTGLDGAGTSNLPAVHDSVIVLGAAAYAALARTVDRADSAQLVGDGAALKAWGDQRLKEFKGMLGFIFPGYLVSLAGTDGGTDEDPAKLAAEVALLNAQAAKVAAETVAIQEGEDGENPEKLAAEIALLQAQVVKVQAEASLAGAQADAIGADGGSAEKLAAEVALLQAQAAKVDAETALAQARAAAVGGDADLVAAKAALTQAQAAAAVGQETRAAAEAARATAERAAEEARQADLHNAMDAPWGTWEDSEA